MGLFGPPNVEKMKANRDVEGLIKALGYQKDVSIRKQAADALGQIGDVRAVEPLVVALKDSGSDVCRAAAESLERLGWKPAQDRIGATYWNIKVEQLTAVFLDKYADYDKIKAAEAALLQIGAPAVLPLIAALRNDISEVRYYAALCLGRIGDARAVEPLIAALNDRERDVRNKTAKALGCIGDARAVEALVAALKDRESNVRYEAAEALGQIGDTLAVEALLGTLKDMEAFVRISAVEALEKMGWTPAQGEDNVPYWTARAESLIYIFQSQSNLEERQQAVDALVKIGPPAVAPLIAAFKNVDHFVRKEAGKALVKIGAPAVEPLINSFRENDSELSKTVAESLVAIGGLAVEPLIAVLKDGEYRVTCEAVGVLGQIGDPRAVIPLIACKNGSNFPLREAAKDALKKIGRSASEPLLNMLKDSDRFIRRSAMDELRRLGDPGIVEPLLAALTDSDTEIRCTAAGALGDIGDTRAVKPLANLLADPESTVMTAAVTALGQIGRRIEKTTLLTELIELLIPMLKVKVDAVKEATLNTLKDVGWKPGQDEIGAYYWSIQRKWDECVKIGAPAVGALKDALHTSGDASGVLDALGQIGAVEPLIAAFKDGNRVVRKAAADTLDKIGWQPGQGENEVIYWDVKIESLISALEGDDWFKRQAAAAKLVQLYQSDLLKKSHKEYILLQRDKISAGHTDETKHDDNGYHYPPSDCSEHVDRSNHTDIKGTGVSFPV